MKILSQQSSGIDDAAAAWIARRDAGWSAADQAEFELWLAADPKHRQVWQEFEAPWGTLDQIRKNGSALVLIRDLATRKRRRRVRRLTGTGCAMVACVIGAFLLRPAANLPISPNAPEGVAIVSRPQQQTLEDGSVIELNKGAEVVVNYGSDRRSVQLLHGEAHFIVAKNAARPFVVTAGSMEVRAVGTAFAVRLEPENVNVVVTEGKVAVDRSSSHAADQPTQSPSILVAAGATVSVSKDESSWNSSQVELLGSADMDRRMAWRGPRLELSGTTLAKAVEMLNRENSVQLSIRDAQLAEMQMSGIFRADNAEGFVRLLQANYGIRADLSPGHIVLSKLR